MDRAQGVGDVSLIDEGAARSKRNKIFKHSTMVKFLVSLCFVLSSSLASEWRNITAIYGNKTMMLDVAIGEDIIEVQSHKPDNAPDSFRETTNLHVFIFQHLVAMRNQANKACYVRHIFETFEELKEKISSIEQHDTSKGLVAEDWIDVADVCPIESWAVKELLGDEIDSFCRFNDVYFVGYVHTGTMDQKAQSRRHKRAMMRGIFVASCCQMPQNMLA
ncbi:uncharacterized protein [Haliotis asinina]|uniref:uncharacterized protein n=1 Tax=Haliotis asinina TaxID=109174 RepID=UPI003531EA99